jgi:hypothetical protein
VSGVFDKLAIEGNQYVKIEEKLKHCALAVDKSCDVAYLP